jgi:hypothetical protein
MEKIALSHDMNVQVRACLLRKGVGTALHGEGYLVRLFDRDFLEDALLGEAIPEAGGNVSFTFPATAIAKTTFDNALPDFFLVVYRHEAVVFKTQVMHDVPLEAIEQYQKGVGYVIDLGTFLVDA